jgi:hypothetical protein
MKAAWHARGKWEVKMEAIIFLFALLVLSLATLRWGFDSRDRFDSPEWERRHNWPSLPAHHGPR